MTPSQTHVISSQAMLQGHATRLAMAAFGDVDRPWLLDLEPPNPPERGLCEAARVRPPGHLETGTGPRHGRIKAGRLRSGCNPAASSDLAGEEDGRAARGRPKTATACQCEPDFQSHNPP